MLIAAYPGFMLWPAAMIFWGEGSSTSLHRHHCVQLVFALEGAVRVRTASRERLRTRAAVLIMPDVPHEVQAEGRRVLVAYVEPESGLGAALTAAPGPAIRLIPPRDVARWRSLLGAPTNVGAARVESWVWRELLRTDRAPRVPPPVARVVKHLKGKLADLDRNDTSLRSLSEVAGLSPSRLMHLFTASVGVPIRPYVLWLRVQRACGELMRGATVTASAQAAGFSDGAHLSRTIRRMLGVTPTELVERRSAGAWTTAETDRAGAGR